MSNALKKLALTTAMMSATLGMASIPGRGTRIQKASDAEPKPKEYRAPRNLTDEQRATKKAHKAKLQARRQRRHTRKGGRH